MLLKRPVEVEKKPIPIPWSKRWRQFRGKILPVIVWTLSIIGVILLWKGRIMP